MRELRLRQELTQEGLAEKLGMLAPNYARIEQGRANVTLDTLVRIANALEVEVIALFERPRASSRVVKPGRPKKAR
jgi:transcriptional regulator with XRE-family HTH domain